MKQLLKILCFTIVFALCLTFIGCDIPGGNSGDTNDGDGAHEHSFGEWNVSVAATCTDDGKETRSCSCGEVEERTVAAGHDLTDWITESKPTCTSEGKRSRGCKKCGLSIESEDISALGHTVTYNVYNGDATATKDGTAKGICSTCRKTVTKTIKGSSALVREAFSGNKISVLGDSISTYINVSNGDAADTTNSTVRDAVLYYDEIHSAALGVDLDDTWWMRTANEIGAELLVNNSWSGSYIKDASTNTLSTPGAYLDRCVQLHDDTGENTGEEPTMIFVYMGTNDYAKYRDNVGIENIDFSDLTGKLAADYIPESVAEAYAIMLYKIKTTYENADIYCLNVLENPSSDEYTLGVFNGMIETICTQLGATYVDICANSGISSDKATLYELYVPSDDGDNTKNTLHPNATGMSKISDALLDVIYKKSGNYPSDSEFLELLNE